MIDGIEWKLLPICSHFYSMTPFTFFSEKKLFYVKLVTRGAAVLCGTPPPAALPSKSPSLHHTYGDRSWWRSAAIPRFALAIASLSAVLPQAQASLVLNKTAKPSPRQEKPCNLVTSPPTHHYWALWHPVSLYYTTGSKWNWIRLTKTIKTTHFIYSLYT